MRAKSLSSSSPSRVDANTSAGVDQVALTVLATGLRRHLEAHLQMGITTYPLTPELAGALTGQPVSAAPPAKQAKQRQSNAATPAVQPAPLIDVPGQETLRLPLLQEIAACQRCPLGQDRQGQVNGAGPIPARLMLIGDFSQQSGEFSESILFNRDEDAMLANMLRAIGLGIEEVYITNALKCCPMPQVTPEEQSVRACAAFLFREIALVQPQIICAMGDLAAYALLERKESVARLRGKLYPYKKGGEALAALRIVTTFHPRLLLAHPEMKRAAWQDLQLIQKCLAGIAVN